MSQPTAGFRIDGWRLHHPDGRTSAVVATGNLDLDSLDDRRRTLVTEAFASLCRGLEHPLQVLVQIRRLDPPPPEGADGDGGAELGSACDPIRGSLTGPAEPVGLEVPGDEGGSRSPHSGPVDRPRLQAAMREHWHRSLSSRPVFGRSVLLIPSCPPPPGRSLERAVAAALRAAASAGLDGRILEDGELERLLRASLGAPGASAGPRLGWRERAGSVELGGLWLRGFSMRRLPGGPVRPGWLAALLGVQAACDVSVHLAPAAAAEAVSSLGRRLRGLSAQRLIDLDRGLTGDAWNEAAMDSASALRDRLARNQSRPLRISLCAVARGADPVGLDRAARRLQAALAATLVPAEPARFRQLGAALTAAPLGSHRLGCAKLVDCAAAATCLPWTHAGCDEPGGYRLGTLAATGEPVRLNLFDCSRHGNANLAILASSGHGKSFAIGLLVLEALAQDTPSVMIDPEEEYRALVSATGGTYLSLVPGAATAVNVFELGGGDSAAEERAEAIQGAVELVDLLCGGRLDQVQRALVELAARGALERAASTGAVPLLSDCIAELEQRAPPLALVLRRVCSGALGELFNRPTSLHLDAGVTAISLRELGAEFVPAATLLISRWLWRLVRDRPGRRHVILDEVGALSVHPAFRALLVQLARRCRKHGASLVVATQNARDLLQSDDGAVVATNCATLLLGGHQPAETITMAHAFGLSEGQRHLLETATRGEFLLATARGRVEIRIEVPELHRRLLTAAVP